MYFHLVCSPEFFAVPSSRKSARKLFRRSRELMVLKDHEFGQNPTFPLYAFHPWPFHAGISFCIGKPHRRVHPIDEQQAASVTASHNPGHGTKGDIKGCESRLGASISPRFPTLDGRPRRPILPFWQL